MNAVVAENIPAELRQLRQWICWKLEPGQPKPKKMPYTITGGHASTTNRATWSTFDECVAAAKERQYSGVGFVFTADDQYVGVDLDGISWDDAQKLEGLAALLPCYVELSQSGKGIHLIMKGKLPVGGNRKGPIEMYQHGRYFAITGVSPDGDFQPDTLEDRTDALAAFHAQHIDGFQEPGQGTGASGPLADADTALIATIESGPNDRLWARLYDGEFTPNRRSEADHDLAKLLCRYTTDDEQVARMMRASDLRRDKWSERRGDTTWLGHTIGRARRKVRGPVSVDRGPLEITALELSANPALLQVPDGVSPWLAWQGEYSITVGREKLAGKTTLAASDATAALRAGRIVLWVTAEESQNRVLKRFADLQAPLSKLILLRRWPQSWEEVEDVIARRQPDVIYVDSQSSFLFAVDGEVPQTSEPEKWQSKGLRFKRWCTLVPDHQAGVNVLVHANKASGEYAGSVGIGAAADTIITMRPVENRPNDRLLKKNGRWGFPSQTLRYVDAVQGYVDAPDADISPTAKQPKLPKGEMKKMLAVLKPGMTYSEWEKAYGGNKETFKSYVGRLKERGLLTQDPITGTWSPAQFDVEQELAA